MYIYSISIIQLAIKLIEIVISKELWKTFDSIKLYTCCLNKTPICMIKKLFNNIWKILPPRNYQILNSLLVVIYLCKMY